MSLSSRIMLTLLEAHGSKGLCFALAIGTRSKTPSLTCHPHLPAFQLPSQMTPNPHFSPSLPALISLAYKHTHRDTTQNSPSALITAFRHHNISVRENTRRDTRLGHWNLQVVDREGSPRYLALHFFMPEIGGPPTTREELENKSSMLEPLTSTPLPPSSILGLSPEGQEE